MRRMRRIMLKAYRSIYSVIALGDVEWYIVFASRVMVGDGAGAELVAYRPSRCAHLRRTLVMGKLCHKRLRPVSHS